MHPDRQLDLFARPASWPEPAPAPELAERVRIAADRLSDAVLLRLLPDASPADAPALAAEVARRRLDAAVPVLARLCERLKGFYWERAVPEQVAALDALAAIGGRAAADAVATLIAGAAIGPGTLPGAMAAASRLGSRLPSAATLAGLRHPDPAVRADACRLAGRQPDVVAVLTDLLEDLHDGVSAAAACALGRMGRAVARPRLLRLLAQAPSAETIDAFAPIADADGLVVLARIARSDPTLTAAVLAVLDDSEEPRAPAIAAGIRRQQG
jgi:hypothetical protein